MCEQNESSRVQAWRAMTQDDRVYAVRAAVWGYGDEKLHTPELVAIVAGEHGADLAQRFTQTLTAGMSEPGGGPVRSFGLICVKYDSLALLEQLAAKLEANGALGVALSKFEWLDRMCTRVTREGRVITWTLYQTAAEMIEPKHARRIFEFALTHQPDHPHVAEVLACGGRNAAVLQELVMRRHIGSRNAAGAQPESQASEAQPEQMPTQSPPRARRAL